MKSGATKEAARGSGIDLKVWRIVLCAGLIFGELVSAQNLSASPHLPSWLTEENEILHVAPSPSLRLEAYGMNAAHDDWIYVYDNATGRGAQWHWPNRDLVTLEKEEKLQTGVISGVHLYSMTWKGDHLVVVFRINIDSKQSPYDRMDGSLTYTFSCKDGPELKQLGAVQFGLLEQSDDLRVK